MKMNRSFLSGSLAGATFVAASWLYFHSVEAAETPVKVLLENERVRVREVRLDPDVKPGPHTHPYAHVGVILDPGTLRFTTPDGKSEEVNFKSGSVGWREAKVTHEVVNVSQSPMRIIEVELKQ
jgi:quercetin dioxygenase-like cupin family protein